MSTKKIKKNTTTASELPSGKKEMNLKWMYVFLFGLAVALYINTFNHEFAFDDSVVISGNKYTQQGIDGIKTLATKDLFYGIYGRGLNLEGGRWRPLTLVMFAIEYQFFGDNASAYHGMNILLYGVSALLLFAMLLSVFNYYTEGKNTEKNILLSFVATLLFIAHPIHTEVVANIKSRDEIMSFLLLCLSVLFLFKYLSENKKSWIAISVLAYFMALLSKENGITFLAVIPVLLFLFAKKNVKSSLSITLPYLIVAGVYLSIRTSLVGMVGDRVTDSVTDNPFLQLNFPDLPTPIPFIEKFATVCWILLKYVLLLIFPHPLTSDYGFSQIKIISLTNPKAILSLLFYAGLIFYSLHFLFFEFKKKTPSLPSSFSLLLRRLIVFAMLYHIITISIISNLFFLIGTSMGERFIYITSLGFCLVLAVGCIHLFKLENVSLNTPSSLTKLYPLLLLLISYSYKIIDRNKDWKSNNTLFTADVKTSTNSANAHYYYANTLFTEHLNDTESPKRDSIFKEAKDEFRKAISINPYFHYCYYNIGWIYEKFNKPDSAIFYLQKAINLKPINTTAQYMAKGELGLVYGKLLGDFNKAIPLLKEALLYQQDNTGYHENLGICYAMKGDFKNSVLEFQESIRLKTAEGKTPTKEDAKMFMNIAISFQQMGDKAQAENYFTQAFRLDPSLKK